MKVPLFYVLATLALVASFLARSVAGRSYGLDSQGFSRNLLGAKQCLCIFDFTGTIWLPGHGASGSVAKDAVEVIRSCKERGYGIAIASTNAGDQMKGILRDRLDGSVFTDDFFQSAAFQTGNLVKSSELSTILEFFKVKDPRCAMFFDDQTISKVFSILTGVTHHPVNNFQGIAVKDIKQAWEKMPGSCQCPRF